MSEQTPRSIEPGITSSLLSSVSITEPWALLERFSELARVSGSDEEVEAAEYIVERLTDLDIPFTRYDPELYISQPLRGAIRTVDRPFEPGPVKTISFSASGTVSGEVVYVGEAGADLLSDEDSTPGEPFSHVEDLTGKIALTSAGFLSIEATRALERKGAAAVITIHPHKREPHDGIATPIWGGAPTLDQVDELPSVPIITVNNPDGEVLIGWATEDRPFTVEVETELNTGWMKCPLVVAEIEGGETDTDEFVLLHGHYDSWYVGITDNATGDAGLLECARIFSNHADRLKRNLRVAWWPGHSTGRYAGSTWYADTFALELAEHCVAQVNMDSPGAKGATEYTDMSCWTPDAHNVIAASIEEVTEAPYTERFPFRAGDYSFDNLGLTGMFMLSSNIPADEREAKGYHTVGGCGGNSDAWHVSTDSLDKAGKDELARDIRVYALSILRVLNADILPFDQQRYLGRIKETVETYNEIAGDQFDFSPTIDAIESVEPKLATFTEQVERGEIPTDNANNVLLQLARIYNRIYLVRDGQFEQDPAIGRDPIPAFAPVENYEIASDDEAKFLTIQLTRAQNGICGQLRTAKKLLTEAN
ncbi:M28 family peptidase [Halorubraceae archaeon YAN]|nr:M28 family peptidase [Halorubraceae archaeon YAN]